MAFFADKKKLHMLCTTFSNTEQTIILTIK